MLVHRSLVEKYNRPVPRYTSYPPANFFEDFAASQYVDLIEESNSQAPQNISLYIHIPFCTMLCHFCGCNTQYTKEIEDMRRYVGVLKKEIVMLSKLLDKSRKVSQVHWGGGTPNALPIELIEEVMMLIHQHFTFIDHPEIAIECHPAKLDKKYVDKLYAAGFNRFSLGIQDFKADVLKNVNRLAPTVPVKEIVDWIRSHENVKVNLDFIYGLPFQTVNSFEETIEKAIYLQPDRLVTFSYAHVPWIKRAQKILEKRGLPDAEEKLKMFEIAYHKMLDAGYEAIGLDHFAKPNDELSVALKNRTLHRNFQGYCTRETTGQVYAVGTTGISQMENGYAQNNKNTEEYFENIQQNKFSTVKGYKLSFDEKVIRKVINELMCNSYCNFDTVASDFNCAVHKIKEIIRYNEENLTDFVKEELLIIKENELFVTEIGRFFVRIIASTFDPKLKATKNKFSKAL